MSLRFRDQGEENGFVHSCSVMLLDNTFSMALVLFVMTSAFATVFPRWLSVGIKNGEKVAGLPLSAIFVSSISMLAVMGLATAVTIKLPCLIRRIGLQARERLVVGGLMVSLLVGCLCNPFYFIFLAGHNPYDVMHFHFGPVLSDGGTLMLGSVLVTASHMALPLRWCTLIPFEVLAVSVAVTMGAVRWATATPISSPTENIMVVLMFLSNIISAVIGKRQLEFANRLTFKTLLRERTQRCQAEFRLSQTAAEAEAGRQGPADVASQHGSIPASTTSSGPIFASMAAEAGNQMMRQFLEMGASEHWLLREDEITLSREILGRGGFGVVVAGSLCGSPAAVKIALGRARHSKVDAALANELRILRRLRHPNIVLFHGTCVNPNTGDIVLVLARVFGERLDNFVRGGDDAGPPGGPPGATEGACFQVLVGVARSLLYIHSRSPPVVHGDLKPSNYLVEVHSTGPCPKLLDFGLSRLRTRGAKPLGGTLRWASPEAMGGAPGGSTPHPSADMFSFGRLAFFICVGVQPLRECSRERIEERARAMVAEPLEWPAVLAGLAAHCRHLVDGCTQVDPASRPSIGDAFSSLLQWQGGRPARGQAAEGAAASARPGGGDPRLWELVERTQREQKRMDGKAERKELRRQMDERAQRVGLRRAPGARPQGEPPLPILPEVGDVAVKVYPEEAETPRRSIFISLLDTMALWNFRRPVSSCCAYHAALEVMREHLEDLGNRACQSDFLQRVVVQCPVCKLLCPDVSTEDEGFCCRICGYEAESASNNEEPIGA